MYIEIFIDFFFSLVYILYYKNFSDKMIVGNDFKSHILDTLLFGWAFKKYSFKKKKIIFGSPILKASFN